ncbi:MAG: hypothetical protein L0L39_06515 [Atopostipes suicloacalis]|nr:hypothetical protein [Atopostipes suicloacalis]MDN6731819.1 hypothetical protein [Atopostipes suicloacalis]
MGKSVNLKGKNEGYLLLLDDQAGVEKIFRETEELFKEIKKEEENDQKFELVIDSGNRLLTNEQQEKITKIIKESIDFDIKEFKSKVIDRKLANKWHEDTSPLVISRNIRNGQMVQSERDIILVGDLRPGGLVRSAGNITIIGEVHGTIHAGSKGAEEAVIIAPFLYNSQVRIGEHVEIIESQENKKEDTTSDQARITFEHQVVYLNDLHVIEFSNVNELAKKRPDFAKDLGGFKEWQKQL